MEDTLLTLIIGILGISIILGCIWSYYKPYFEVLRDIDNDPVLIIWYNTYTPHGDVIREHKIIYDKRRNKK